MKNKKNAVIIALCILTVAFAAFAVWGYPKDEVPAMQNGGSEAPVTVADIGESQVALAGSPEIIYSGDIVVLNVFADVMEDVYGYQFNIVYDREFFEYSNSLYSDIDEIITIFATDKEQYLLVGATMIGDMKGHSGNDIPVCHVEFAALKDMDSEIDSVLDQFAISRVNVVTDDLRYFEDIDGWRSRATIRAV